MSDVDTTQRAGDADDEKKQSKSFSLTRGLLRQFQQVMDENHLPPSEQSELAEFLLGFAIEQVRDGKVQLPVQQVSVLRKTK